MSSIPTPPLFITPAELHYLTGYEVARCQIAWLRAHGWRFETNAAGAPRVARAYFERRMVGEASAPEPGPAAKHNFAAHAPGKTELRRVK